MIVIKEVGALQRWLDRLRKNGTVPAFVPTMGALHEGHIMLTKQAKPVICSIFVNPTQFNDPADYAKYPVTLEEDIVKLEQAGVDILFLPTVAQLYPNGTQNLEKYDLGYLETVLEGKFRPGHFQGVCQVMYRLLKAVGPCRLYMGQKDYQQCMVVKRLIELTQLPADLIPCPTVREADGLAMSSRNKRLNAEERKNAIGIYRALTYIKEHIKPGNLDAIRNEANAILAQHHFKTDYVEVATADDLELVTAWNGQTQLVALIAAFQNEVRLIDNLRVTG
jgi:pantoate--beta-alanine ligase